MLVLLYQIKKMTQQEQEQLPQRDRKGSNDKIITGIFFLIVGVLLLANKMGAGVPDWFFDWPSIIILIGIYTGVKHRFQNFSWLIITAIGTLFLVDHHFVPLNLKEYTLPIILIAVGFLFLTRPRHKWHDEQYWKHHYGRHRKNRWHDQWQDAQQQAAAARPDVINTTDGEFIEVNAVFGSAKKMIFSKDFKGGEINCFMGGAEIDLTQADIQGHAVIEANQVFGGTKLVIPPHWDLKIEATSFFGGLEDKRPPVAAQIDHSKVLIIKGANVFGGLEIKSY